jgi:IS5 family transposase
MPAEPQSIEKTTMATSFQSNIDKKYKVIRKIEADTASRHDSQHFENVFDTGNTSNEVYAYRGYPSKGRSAWLKENGYRNQIQRKGSSNMPLSECQQRRNHRIAKIRARVEHVFGAIEQMKGKAIRTIGQFRAKLCDDYDGYLLQSQTISLLPKGWH